MSLYVRARVENESLTLDVELTVAAGEIVALVGPNGAGKTTLLRAVAGLLPLTAGTIRIGDRTVEDTATGIRVPAEDRRVGMVFQDGILFPHLTARDNVAFGMEAAGMDRTAAHRRADSLLVTMGLSGFSDSMPNELSGGEAQRVALARALAIMPEVLALDEPLAALDVETRQNIRRELATRLDLFSGPTLLVTHDPMEAAMLADRLVVLESGTVTQAGTVAEVTGRPRSPWVARLAGVNLLKGTAVGNEVTIDGGAGIITTADQGTGPVFLLFRPHSVALYETRPEGSPRNTWRGTITNLETFGGRVRVHVAADFPITAEVTPAAVAALRLREGNSIWASVKATEIELYPVGRLS